MEARYGFVQDTRTYYACWLGEEDAFLFDAGVRLIRSDTRDRAQPGYSDPFALWVWAEPGRLLVSYGARAASRMERLQTLLEPDLPAVESAHTGCFSWEDFVSI